MKAPLPAHAAGWFGKLVMLGDFAQRRLPPAFVSACDDWLSRSLQASRVQLGPHWLDTYLSAPIWRFAWAPGVVDAHWWYGILMPSVDAVGRYFPLVVAIDDPHPPLTPAALHALAAWYASASQAAQGTLQAGATLDQFEAALAALPPWQPAQPINQSSDLAPTTHQLRLPGPASASLSAWAYAASLPLWTRHYARHSFWLPLAADDREITLHVVAGLPEAERYAEMLGGPGESELSG